ncbi:hypothetical protein MPSEU_000790100 [Mayamaea pseudoterrestris]|nr:hypothetical protein MPSEU_000790100 [Mayamaea pseudoterrestris]
MKVRRFRLVSCICLMLGALAALASLALLLQTSYHVYQSNDGMANTFDAEMELHLRQNIRREAITFANATATSSTAFVTAPPHHQSSVDTRDESHCYSLNSQAWLDGPRLGNLQDSSLIDLDLFSSDSGSVTYLQRLLGQSVCAEYSRFRNMQDLQQLQYTTDINATIHAWTIRLAYWAMHYHQSKHALLEATHRHANCPLTSSIDIGTYDYECVNAKYIVASLANVGLGANVRGGMVYGYLAGLISDRVVVFVNDLANASHKFLRRPWALVSCDGDNGNGTDTSRHRRRDAQCFFMPSTPCVLTHADIQQAYALTNKETQKLVKQGIPPVGHEQDKVWYMKLGFTPLTATPVKAAERLRKYASLIIQQYLLPRANASDEHYHALQTMLHQAADNMLRHDEPRQGYNYGAANVKIHHALVVYAMRPRRDKAARIKQQLENLLRSHNVQPETSFGLPIRASDKCVKESECLSFEQHMQATSLVWADFNSNTSRNDSTKPLILFTTESTAIVQDQINFTTNHPDFPFRIVSNTYDVTPNTGFITNAEAGATSSADDILLSAVTSLQLQLQARVTLGNCCSNFHTMLADLLAAGCGAASQNDFHCFQELEDPNLRICCGWFKNCKEDKLRAVEANNF